MEIKKIKDEKNKFVFEVKGVSHGFCNILKEKLLEDKHIKTATYRVEHPLVNIPSFLVETDGSETPKNAVLNAVKKLKTVAESAKKELSKELK